MIEEVSGARQTSYCVEGQPSKQCCCDTTEKVVVCLPGENFLLCAERKPLIVLGKPRQFFKRGCLLFVQTSAVQKFLEAEALDPRATSRCKEYNIVVDLEIVGVMHRRIYLFLSCHGIQIHGTKQILQDRFSKNQPNILKGQHDHFMQMFSCDSVYIPLFARRSMIGYVQKRSISQEQCISTWQYQERTS